MGYFRQKIWDIYSKTKGYIIGYIGQNYGIYWGKTMAYIGENLWDIMGKNYGIYWAKTMGYIMGYMWQKL